MPIKSYIVHPINGKRDELIECLSKLPECEVTLAKNDEILIMVSETENETQELELKQKLDAITSIKLLSLVSGFNTPIKN